MTHTHESIFLFTNNQPQLLPRVVTKTKASKQQQQQHKTTTMVLAAAMPFLQKSQMAAATTTVVVVPLPFAGHGGIALFPICKVLYFFLAASCRALLRPILAIAVRHKQEAATIASCAQPSSRKGVSPVTAAPYSNNDCSSGRPEELQQDFFCCVDATAPSTRRGCILCRPWNFHGRLRL